MRSHHAGMITPGFTDHSGPEIISRRQVGDIWHSSGIYHDEIPIFAASALEQLYASIYCTIARIGLYESLAGINTFIAMRGQEIHVLILFRVTGSAIRVINQQIALGSAELETFADAVFARYEGVRRLEFHALDACPDCAQFSYPCQKLACLEENVVSFPATGEEYLTMMSSKTRAMVRKNIRKSRLAYPSYRFEVLVGEQITAEHIAALIGLTDQRMRFKGRASYIASSETERLAALARTYGYMGLIFIDGEICAGSLCYGVGSRHFAHLIGHDPRYNSHGLGIQVSVQTAFHSIAAGATELWMMGGRREEKARFLARCRMLDRVIVYRSRRAALLSWRRYLGMHAGQRLVALRAWIDERTTQPDPAARVLREVLGIARRARLLWRQAHLAVLGAGASATRFRRDEAPRGRPPH